MDIEKEEYNKHEDIDFDNSYFIDDKDEEE